LSRLLLSTFIYVLPFFVRAKVKWVLVYWIFNRCRKLQSMIIIDDNDWHILASLSFRRTEINFTNSALTSSWLSSPEPSWTAVSAAKINIYPTIEKFQEDLTEVSSMLINSFARKSIICVYDVCIYFEKKRRKLHALANRFYGLRQKWKGHLLCFRSYFFMKKDFLGQDVSYLPRTVDTRPIRTDGHHKEGCHRESRNVGCFS